tara:strand:- start:1586 stop:1783 length:198 start_codon:yes stop_codon:yes gene_type:complete
MSVEEVVWPLVICVFLSIAVSKFSGCAENSFIEDSKQVQSYIDAGCRKAAVMGSQGTHWVCTGND